MDIEDIIEELLPHNRNINLINNIINLANPNLEIINLLEEREQTERNKNFYEVTIQNYSPDDFFDHFRMSREIFEILVQNLNENRPIEADRIPFEKKILFFLWILGKQESFLAAGDRFDFAKSSEHDIFFEICSLISNLRQRYISWPDNNKKSEITQEFENKCGIPGIVGAIYGTHIEIKCPEHNGVDFYNRNNYHSVILQAVCDNRMLFTDIFVGCPGRMHDARVFSLSPIHQFLNNNLLPRNEHIIGDAAYPLTLYLLKPYRDNGHLNNVQTLYNIRLSSARSVIERAFGQLKGKFRRLKYLDMSRADIIPHVITAACVLHNFILINNNYEVHDYDIVDQNVQMPPDNNVNDAALRNAAEIKRTNLAIALQ